MDDELFLNCGILPQFQYEQPPLLSVAMPAFHPFSMELNSPSSDFFFGSAISSMAPSPSSSNPHIITESFMIRELMGKLGNICNNSNGSNETSCYNTPLGSPHKINFPMIDHFTNLGNSVLELPALAASDHAATVSFSGTNQSRGNNISTLHRISSSPVLNAAAGSHMGVEIQNGGINLKNLNENGDPGRSELGDSAENNPSLSGRNITGDRNGVKYEKKDLSSRKRKTNNNRGNVKEVTTAMPESSTNKVVENRVDDDRGAKRSKSTDEGDGDEEDANKKQCSNENLKHCEPPKDYIHVRARRGQATDSHSLAERVRREKISERMKLLQDLVPGCNKVTGKALMLDEIINYVQSLQKQVEMSQPSSCSSLPQQTYPLVSSSTSRVYSGHQPLQNLLQAEITSTTMTPSSIHLLHATLNRDVSQLSPLFEDDLQSIVDMGLVQSAQVNAQI